MYRLLFASVQLHVFWKSLICIRPLDRLVLLAVALLGARHSNRGSRMSTYGRTEYIDDEIAKSIHDKMLFSIAGRGNHHPKHARPADDSG